MRSVSAGKNELISIELSRDDCKVIESRAGDPEKLKKAFAKLRRILKGMPPSSIETLKDLENTRQSRGLV